MLEQLSGLLERIGSAANAQKQREAMIDLLIWTMYADNVLTLPENDRIEKVSEEMKWESAMPAAQYLNLSIAKVRDVLDNQAKADDLLEDIRTRLGTAEMRREAYEACRDLAKSDGEIADKEMDLLTTVKERFNIATDS